MDRYTVFNVCLMVALVFFIIGTFVGLWASGCGEF